MPALAAGLIPRLRDLLERTRQDANRDPVEAVDVVAECERRIQAAQELIGALVECLDDSIPNARQHEAALRAKGVEPQWIDRSLRAVFEAADRFLADLAGYEPMPPTPDATAELGAVAARAERAFVLETRRTDVLETDRAETEERIELARAEIAGRLSLAPAEILAEADADPGVLLTTAAREAERALALLGTGDLNAAEQHLNAQRKLIEEARSLVRETREAFARHRGTVDRLGARRRAIVDDQLPRQSQVLAELRKTYDSGALAHDAEQAEGDQTIANNAEQARHHARDAEQLLAEADELFADGAILQAAHALARTGAHYDLAELRLIEIHQRRALLEKTEADNSALLDELHRSRNELDRQMSQPFVTERTVELLGAVSGRLDDLAEDADRGRRNPFAFAERAVDIRESVHEVRRRVGADHESHAEARRSLAMASEMIERALDASDSARRDQVVDSAEIIRVRDATRQLERELEALEHAGRKPHGDWVDLDRSADRIHNEAARCRDVLVREAEAGRGALSVVERAGELHPGSTRGGGQHRQPGQEQLRACQGEPPAR